MSHGRFILFVIIAFWISCNSKPFYQRKISFLNNDDFVVLNGNVKQLTVAPVDGEYSTNPGQDYDIFFIDKRGDVSKNISGFHGMVSTIHYITTYDQNNKKSKTAGYFKSSDLLGINIPNATSAFGKVSQLKTGDQLVNIFRYNRQNQIISCVYDPNKPAADSSTYNYNGKGQLIALNHYANPKLLMDVTKYEYDNNDNLIESDKFHWNRLEIKTVYEYKAFDSNNNWILMTVHSQMSMGMNFTENKTFKRKIIYY